MNKERRKELRNRVASIRACMQNADPPDSVYSMALEAVNALDSLEREYESLENAYVLARADINDVWGERF